CGWRSRECFSRLESSYGDDDGHDRCRVGRQPPESPGNSLQTLAADECELHGIESDPCQSRSCNDGSDSRELSFAARAHYRREPREVVESCRRGGIASTREQVITGNVTATGN